MDVLLIASWLPVPTRQTPILGSIGSSFKEDACGASSNAAPSQVDDENIDPELREGGNGIGLPQVQAVPVRYPYPVYPAPPHPLPLAHFFPHPGAHFFPPFLPEASLEVFTSGDSTADVDARLDQSPSMPPPSPPSTVPDPTPPTPPPTQPSTARQPSGSKRNRSNTASAGAATAPKKTKAELASAANEAVVASKESLGLHWSIGDWDLLYRFLLDGEHDKNFETLKKNRNYVYDKVSKELFNGHHSQDAVHGMWDCSLKTYGFIDEFEDFTGGDGNGDLASLKDNMEAARAAGKQIGGLTAKTYKEWESKQWMELFDSRYASSPRIRRKKERHSNMPLSSDNKQEVVKETNNSTTSARNVLHSLSAGAAAARGTVSEPKHVHSPSPSQKSRGEVSQSMASIGLYLKDKVASDRDVQVQLLEVRKARLELDRCAADCADEELRLRQEQQEKQANAALAKDVLAVEGASKKLCNAAESAESFLMKMFDSSA